MSSPRNNLRAKSASAVATAIRTVADRIGNGATRDNLLPLAESLRHYSAADIKAGASQAGMTLSGSGKADLIKQVVSRLDGRLGTEERTQFRGR